MGIREIAEILCCPVCHGPLENHIEENAMECPNCKLRFTVEGDVLNMLPAQALALEDQ
jgi:uncharacterized protein YbaR (Trm112 family)